MAAEEKQVLQQVTDGIHHQFIRDIADGREMEIEKVRQVADGRIFTGEAAVQMGLVDRLGNLEDAVQWAGELTGVKGEVEAVYPRETDLSLLKYLTETTLKVITESALNNRPYIGYLYLPAE
jgi:protease-4